MHEIASLDFPHTKVVTSEAHVNKKRYLVYLLHVYRYAVYAINAMAAKLKLGFKQWRE